MLSLLQKPLPVGSPAPPFILPDEEGAGFYHAQPILTADDAALRDARLTLAMATRQVLANGLDLMGVSAPEAM